MANVDEAVQAARNDDFLRALTMFLDIYGSEEPVSLSKRKAAMGLSWFGLSLALIRKRFKPAIDLCRRAIELEFYNGDHYANLARVYVVAGNRKKAWETIEEGLRKIPEHDYLLDVKASLGVRADPAVPFLSRTNPINVSLGQSRHAKKLADEERKKR